jgi:hypothetical protein
VGAEDVVPKKSVGFWKEGGVGKPFCISVRIIDRDVDWHIHLDCFFLRSLLTMKSVNALC